MEEMIDVIVLNDDEGNEMEFVKLDMLEYQGETYIMLAPADAEDEDEVEVVILRVEGDADVDDEEMTLEGIDDEALLETLFELFVENAED